MKLLLNNLPAALGKPYYADYSADGELIELIYCSINKEITG